MAVRDSGRPRRSWLDALFGEAWELQRRRRRRLFVALLICAAVAVLAAQLIPGEGAHVPVAQSAPLRVSSIVLPASGSYSNVAAVGGRVIVTGGQLGAALIRGRLSGTCHAARIDAQSLRVVSTARGNCGDPALYGRRVMPVSYVADRRSPTFALALRIAVVAPRAREGYRLGPVALRYPQCSDCNLESIYAGGSVWIYAAYSAPSLARTDRSGTLLRVSASSGRVLERWRMPSFPRALLAADADGAWIAQSLYGGTPSGLSASARTAYRYAYRVAPGMRAPARAFALGRAGAYWMVAADHTVWVGAVNPRRFGTGPALLWRFRGPDAIPVVRHRPVPSGAQCAQAGEGPISTVGDARIGVFCVALGPHGDHLQSFDFVTGVARSTQVPALAHAPVTIFYAGPQSTAAMGGSAFFLLGPHRLFRAVSG